MDGFLNVNKPSGWTSHDVVAHLRSVLKIRKIGHTGTLDPAATGVLPICVGKATKLSHLLIGTDKRYRAVMRLGETTDTQDAEGKILVRRHAGSVTEEQVREALVYFTGPISQIPPMYSAVKVGGQPLYKAARDGREVSRSPRTVTLHRIELLGIEGADISLEVDCSKGTYIRTLCADIGERLGVGAHLLRLERTRSGPFRIEMAASLPELESAAREGRIPEYLSAPGAVLGDFPSLTVTEEGERPVLHGAALRRRDIRTFPKECKTGGPVLVYNGAGQLIALAVALAGRSELDESDQADSRRLFRVDRLLVDVEEERRTLGFRRG
ncbi:MAG TPA: tRNA pseudouridine(55) synthase TruB [Nitrospiria bacterium]